MIKKLREEFDFTDFVWIFYVYFSYTFYVPTLSSRINLVNVFTYILPLIFITKKVVLDNNRFVSIDIKKYFCLIWYAIFILYEYIISEMGIMNESMWMLVKNNACIIFAMCYSIDSVTRFEKFLYDCAIGLMGFGIVAWITSPVSTYGTLNFGGFPARQRNITAYALGMAFTIFIYYFLKTRRRRELIYALICAVVTILTGSRKGLIQLMLPFIVLLICQKDLKKFGKYIILLAVLGAVVLVILLNNSTFMEIYGERFMAIFEDSSETTDMSVITRNVLKVIGVMAFLENPIWGYGLGASWTLVERTGFSFVNYFHNNIIEILTCGGIVGFILYHWIIVKNLFVSFINRKKTLLHYVVLTIIITFLILSIGQVTVYSPHFTFYLYFIVQCGVYMKELEQEQKM